MTITLTIHDSWGAHPGPLSRLLAHLAALEAPAPWTPPATRSPPMVYYHVADAAATRLVSTSLGEIRQWLRDGQSWQPGRYMIFVTDSVPTWLRPPGARWGVATKQPDGCVELISDGPG